MERERARTEDNDTRGICPLLLARGRGSSRPSRGLSLSLSDTRLQRQRPSIGGLDDFLVDGISPQLCFVSSFHPSGKFSIAIDTTDFLRRGTGEGGGAGDAGHRAPSLPPLPAKLFAADREKRGGRDVVVPPPSPLIVIEGHGAACVSARRD